MQLRVERHIITKNHPRWNELDNLCFLSKNLYNAGLYKIKQEFEKSGKWLRYNQLEKLIKEEKNPDFYALPSHEAQPILMQLDKNMKGFFNSLRAWKKDKTRFVGCPAPPKYKHKIKGRNIIISSYAESRINNRDGLIHYPKKSGLSHLKSYRATKENYKQTRIVPQSSCYVIEVVYEVESQNLNLNKERKISIDLGVNNLCAIISNQPDLKPLLINGKPLKSMNQYYNKEKAKFQSLLSQGEFISKRIKKLELKRFNKISNYLHHVSKLIINYCIENNIGTIIIGKNDGWKQNINLGSQNNQNFTYIPFNNLIHQLRYKGEFIGIEVIGNEESYTSKVSALDLESIEFHESYLGKREKRGLFKISCGSKINADVNGSLNIMRKVVGDGFVNLLNKGCVLQPLLVTPI